MRQKRPAPSTTSPTDTHIPAHILEARAEEQDEGTNFYGQAMYSPAKRVRRCHARSCFPFLDCYQDPVPAPPEPAVPLHGLGYFGSSSKGSADMDRGPGHAMTFSKEEDKLILDARNLGKTFTEIAKMLPARNVTTLRKHYTIISKSKAPPIKRPSPPVSANLSPVAAATASLQALAAAAAVTAANAVAAGATALETTNAGRQPSPAASKASRVPSETVEVDYRSTNRSGGDMRIKLSKPLPAAPQGFTGFRAHNLATLDGIKFFQKAEVVDPDDASNVYVFDVDDSTHCACFNIGQSDVVDEDGHASPVIGWNDLHILYQLPDGSMWAEHGNLYDSEDLVKHARELKKNHQDIIPKDTTDRELFKKAGRSHSRLQNIEFECWVFKDSLPSEARLTELGIEKDNAYYSRITFDPKTLDKLP